MAETDLVTLTEAKEALGSSISINSDDQILEADIEGLSELFDRTFGAMVIRDVDAEEFTPNHLCRGWLSLWPIIGQPTSDVGTVTVRRRALGGIAVTDPALTNVTYSAGRYEGIEGVAQQVKRAFIIALRNWQAPSQATPMVNPGLDFVLPSKSFPTFAMPNACTQMLFDMQRPAL